MTNLTVKEELYMESTDVLLQLVNKAKELGYEFKFEEMAEMTGVKLNRNINLIKGVDYITTTAVNKLLLRSNVLFKTQIELYMNQKVSN